MRKILLDTNIILDLLAKREPYHQDSMQIFSLADLGKIDIVVSSLSLVNVHYILNETLKTKNARSIIRKFKVLVTTFDLNDKIVGLALNDDQFSDFEDGIQYYTAIEAKCEFVVTRNLKDFKNSSLPVMSPKEFLTRKISETGE